MGIDQTIDITTEQRLAVLALLKRHLPGTTAWAYGSRVKWTARPQSDLDLVVFAAPEQNGQVGALREALDESSLPFRVDLFVWDTVPESFREQIEAQHVVLVEKEEQSTDGEQLFGFLPEYWEYTALGAACERGGGDIQTGPFGSQLHASDYVSVGIPSIMPQNIGDNRINVDGIARISPDDASRLSRYLVREGDIVYSRRGDVERRALVRGGEDGWLCGTGCLRVRFGESGVDSRYASYFLGHPSVREWVVRHAHGATMPNLNTSILSACPFVIPPKEAQRAIAHILGTLDDKIELNRHMNETLEAMARALFKSWFVDFDPVRAKAALRNHAALEETSAKQGRSSEGITPPLRGSRGDKGASPQASRWGESGATQPPRPWPDIKRQYAPKTLQHAQTLRQNQTNAEGLLWHYLRNKQLGGYKFRRQQPIGPYVADFACLPEKLLIELDGAQHAEPNAPDEQRDRFLRQQGYRVLRFWNHEVFADCFGVLERVYAALADPPPPQPAPDGLASATPPQGGSDWSVDRARAYLDSMDPEIAALFPDRFVDSELGEIPAGWGVFRLNELADHHTKSMAPSTLPEVEFEHFSIPAYDAGQTPAIDQGNAIKSNKIMVPSDAVLLSKLNPEIPRVWMPDTPNEFLQICSTEFLVFTPRYPANRSLLFSLFTDSVFRTGLQSMVTGTSKSHQRVAPKALKQSEVLSGTAVLFHRFGILVAPILARVVRNRAESHALGVLRDALLPKLISGKLRVDMEGT